MHLGQKLSELHGQVADILTWRQYQEWTGKVARFPATYENRFKLLGKVTDSTKALAIAGEALILIYADKEQV